MVLYKEELALKIFNDKYFYFFLISILSWGYWQPFLSITDFISITVLSRINYSR